MFCAGKEYPELRSAERTRSRLSFTAASGRPTVVKWLSLRDGLRSTSTSTR